jgi:TRAP-type mannitol/chloroaromatic compound transport system permease small subunit
MLALIRWVERVVGVVGVAAAMLLVPLVLATCYEVVSRYSFGAPTIWAYEVGYILTGAHFLLGLAYTLRANEHIRIDIFSGKFSERTRAWLDFAAYCIIVPLLLWLSWALFQYLLAGYARGERSGQSALNLPVWPFRVIFTLAFVLFSAQCVVELFKTWIRLNPPGPAHPNDPNPASH